MIGKIREGMNGKQVADLLDENFKYLDHKTNETNLNFNDLTNLFTDFKSEVKDGVKTMYDNFEDYIRRFADSAIIAADEDDITCHFGVARFRDRDAIKDKYTSTGYKILRRRTIGGINKLFQEDFNQENTIYEIRYDFDLGGKEITIPEGCTLKFNGGSISNGTIVGDNTLVEANFYNIFRNINVTGLWNCYNIYVEWFGASGDGVHDDTVCILNAIDFASMNSECTILLLPKIYIISTLNVKYKCVLEGLGEGLTILKQNDIIENKSNILYIPKNSTCFKISKLSILGNKFRNAIGINSESTDWLGSGDHQPLFDKIPYSETLEYYAYKNGIISDIAILSCDMGIKIGTANYAFRVNNIHTRTCKTFSFYNLSTDNLFTNLYLELCDFRGLQEGGGNNKYVNVKCIWNGKEGNTEIGDACGIFISGNRNSFVNVECLDNYASNLIIGGNSNSLSNILFDTFYENNGKRDFNIKLGNNSWFTNIQGIISNYKGTVIPDKNEIIYTDNPSVLSTCNFNIIDSRGKVTFNSSLEKNKIITNFSDSFICYRNSEVIYNNKTYTNDVPVLTNLGLIKLPEDIYYFGQTDINTCNATFSFIIDFIYNNIGNENILLLCPKTSGEYGKFLLSVGTGVYVNFPIDYSNTIGGLFFKDFKLKNDINYRIGCTLFSNNNNYLFVIYISYIDDNNILQLKIEYKSNYYSFSVSSNKPVVLGLKQIDKSNKCIYKKLLFINKNINREYFNVYHNLKDLSKESDLYIDFTNYILPNKYYVSNLPKPSAFYDKKILETYYGGVGIVTYLCIKDILTNEYKWYIINTTNKTKFLQDYSKPNSGDFYFDLHYNKPFWWNNDILKLVDSNGVERGILTQGSSDLRPTDKSKNIGFIYKDTTIGKLILWEGTKWVNLDGTDLNTSETTPIIIE